MLDRPQPKQRRSRARHKALIEIGADLLNERDLEDLSVAEITGTLGCSTGSFYTYFADKAAFFVAVQRKVSADLDVRIAGEFASDAIRDAGAVERLRRCVEFTLEYFRAHTGVIRGALRYEHRIPDAWAPNRASAQRLIDALTDGLAPAVQQRMQVALQMAFGAMVNALLHDPGPLRLNDARFGSEIIAALEPYLAETEH